MGCWEWTKSHETGGNSSPLPPAKLSKPVGAPIGPKHRCWGGRDFEKEKKKDERGEKGERQEMDGMVLLEQETMLFSTVDPVFDFSMDSSYHPAVSKAKINS